ncbi:alpha-hydroxy acid oxidase [Roseibacillus ishigakijimensis]|uniref:Alpha-hydroxy-acid oxidizing protein n=1 Tax=Roseibacillus ishigakijimensis TaxID=454146 RepID=A0A934RR79_9BACT|nr:alpha-hydroxy acid oxidase [Roseibacillus ishigakijimensis]MBK1834146.1 alpha-hydroxy-acid oxidizing protein [Roseibacillus ishigakijimensis]
MDFTAIPSDAVSLIDYERMASGRLSAGVAAYLNGGAADGQTVQANRTAWQQEKIVPRVLRAQEIASFRSELFGRELSSPLLIGPTAYHQLFHQDGELATAQAASLAKVPYVVSAQASRPLESIAQAAPEGSRWFQLYLPEDRAFAQELVHRIEAAGYEALVLTVDAPVNGIRNDEQRANFQLPPGISAVNLPQGRAAAIPTSAMDAGFRQSLPTWEHVAWLKSLTNLPLLLKGILHPDDAEQALSLGVDGLIVSNHGGRTLDQVISTREALANIVTRVAGRAKVLVDGGLRRGTDVWQALALGADAVLLGRPILHGLSVAGAAGVVHVLKLLQHEFEVALLLSGGLPSSIFPNKHS